jgi:hypothetical protein
MRSTFRLAAALALIALAAPPAAAQDDPAVLQLAEPDFTLVSLPTSLRVPTFRGAFRVSHRFTRPLGAGDFGDLVEDLFGIDAGAQIGLEFRYGLIPNGQVGFHRTNDKTIQLFGQYMVLRQGDGPLDASLYLAIDGTNNFRDSYTPSIGGIFSRRFGEVAAVYAEPIWVNNTNPLPAELADDNSTFIVGLGARVRIRPTVYLVGEIAPRVTGFEPEPSVPHGSFGIEKRAGGHVFQLNFSNSFATTMGQIARGGFRSDDWFLGFNISRKFF